MQSKSIFGFDVFITFSVILLMGISILFTYSSGVNSSGGLVNFEYTRQILWVLLGILVIFLMTFLFNYEWLKDLSLLFYIITILVLLVTLGFGEVVNGSRRWLGIWGFGIQPSEFAKLVTVIFLARFLSDQGENIKRLPYFILALGIVLLPMGLVMLQPDLGTSLVFAAIFLGMTFMAGAKIRHLFFLVSVGIMTLVLTALPFLERTNQESAFLLVRMINNDQLILFAVSGLLLVMALAGIGLWKFRKAYFYWMLYTISIMLSSLFMGKLASRVLQDYQITRLLIFIDPSIDPRGAGWNIIQSLTAVGSGGLWGKGFLEGTQSHYRFLPMQSTDFIFSILAEEWGFVGGFLIFLLYGIIFFRMLYIIRLQKNDYGKYLVAGIISMLFFHMFVNTGMAMGIMPVTGLPLYFVSYGGSSLLSAALAVGLVMNTYSKRYS